MTQSNSRLSGRVALVTGGGQGVGQGIARSFARAGATVVIAQRNAEQGEREAERLRVDFGVKAAYIQTDVTAREQVEAMVAFVERTFGKLDILVNNAGASFPKKLENHSDEDMATSFALNYWAAFWAMRAAFPGMKARGYGKIINLGSLNGVNAHMYTAAYNASKEALRALSRTAAVEWGPYNINTNVICPSASSPQAEDYFAANPEMLARILEQIPKRKIGNAETDIGPTAVFLASEDGSFVNGQTLFVDGGSHINGVSWKPHVAD